MGATASQITSLTIVFSSVYSDANQRKHQSSASLVFVRGIYRGPVNSSHKWPITRKMFPFDDIIIQYKPQKGLKLTWQTLLSALSPVMALSYDICMVKAKCESRKYAEPAHQGSRQQVSRDVKRHPILGIHNGAQTFRLMGQSISVETLTRRLSRLSTILARGSH